MFTQTQFAQISQLIIKNFNHFPSNELLNKIYEIDYAAYRECLNDPELADTTYEEWFGNIFEDMYGEMTMLEVIEEAMLAQAS